MGLPGKDERPEQDVACRLDGDRWISSERFMISSLLVFGREEDDEFFVQACALSGAQARQKQWMMRPAALGESVDRQGRIFQRLSDFATTCQEHVFDRFPDVPVYGHFNMFESVEALELRDVAPSFEALGTFYHLAENHLESFLSGLRKLWAEQSAEVAKGQTADEDLGDTVGDQCLPGEVVEELATKVPADTGLRFAVAVGGWYKKNGRLIQRKPAQRSDFGSKRTKCICKNRTQRLASQPVLRGLRVEGSSHILAPSAPSSEEPIPDIMQEHSPPKKRVAPTTE
ncbi:unnamed protein product [Symbiodinium sp. KB8]|nr:unnamed protein product [Symbiodinium sp. KB8]